jgi:large subunit ribosomal protein L21
VYAIVATGGKQYRVEPGQRLEVETIAGEPGSQIELGEVLLVADGENVTVGQPTVPGARVVAELLGEAKGKKIIVFKYKNKVRYRRKTGHRQKYSRLMVRDIVRA